jgi:MFS family permease
MSESYKFAIFMRVMCGIVNGNTGVVKSMLGEITDESNRGRAFGLWESAFGLGNIIGPVIGGLMADPTVFLYNFIDSISCHFW